MQETERLLKEIAEHPHRIEIKNIFKETQALVKEKIVPFYRRDNGVADGFEAGLRDVILRLTHVETGVTIFLRKTKCHA